MRRPLSAILLIAIMATAIGATTAVFSVLDAVLLRPVPFRDSNELVELWTRDDDGSAYPRLDRERANVWTAQSGLFERVERYVDKSMLLGGVEEPEQLRVVYASPGLFSLLGVTPAEGRAFTADDMRGDAPQVALVSGAFFRHHLAAVPANKPALIHLDDQPVLVVGVMPDWFRYPRGIVSVWMPLRDTAVARGQQLNYIARLHHGMDQGMVRRKFDDYARRLAAAVPRKEGWGVAPMFLNAPQLESGDRTALFVLAGAVLCVMLVACVNAANLLLAEATVRRRELAIRAALGATPIDIATQLLAESLVLATIGAAIGILLSSWAVELIVRIMPRDLSIFGNADVGIDMRVLGFAVAASVTTWILCSAGPALHASRAPEMLVMGDRTATGGRGMRRVRGALAVAELSLSLMLICGAGLFMRSLANLTDVNPGFDVAHVLSADLGISLARYPTPSQRAQYLDNIQREVRGLPGVSAVSLAGGLPPQSGVTFGRLEAEGSAPLGRGVEAAIPFAEVDTGFFNTLGIRLLHGRAFTSQDLGPGGQSRIVSANFAATLWPGADPIGRRFRLGPTQPWSTVVGVVGEVKLMGADDRKFPYEIYYPRSPIGRATRYVSLAVRTDRDPKTLLTSVRRTIRRVNPDQPIARLAPAAELFAESVAKARFTFVLLSIFAAIGLALAVAGTYSVLTYAVVQRRREIGIRMALGAESHKIVRDFVRDGLLLATTGVMIGLVGVLFGARMLGALLFGVTPHDPVVLVTMSILLLAVSLVAALVPALRASRVSPVVAMMPD